MECREKRYDWGCRITHLVERVPQVQKPGSLAVARPSPTVFAITNKEKKKDWGGDDLKSRKNKYTGSIKDVQRQRRKESEWQSKREGNGRRRLWTSSQLALWWGHNNLKLLSPYSVIQDVHPSLSAWISSQTGWGQTSANRTSYISSVRKQVENNTADPLCHESKLVQRSVAHNKYSYHTCFTLTDNRESIILFKNLVALKRQLTDSVFAIC